MVGKDGRKEGRSRLTRSDGVAVADGTTYGPEVDGGVGVVLYEGVAERRD